jgi:hypothetical protein
MGAILRVSRLGSTTGLGNWVLCWSGGSGSSNGLFRGCPCGRLLIATGIVLGLRSIGRICRGLVYVGIP